MLLLSIVDSSKRIQYLLDNGFYNLSTIFLNEGDPANEAIEITDNPPAELLPAPVKPATQGPVKPNIDHGQPQAGAGQGQVANNSPAISLATAESLESGRPLSRLSKYEPDYLSRGSLAQVSHQRNKLKQLERKVDRLVIARKR